MVSDEGLAKEISEWIGDYAEKNGIHTLVVGVSGGIDSAVTSTLAAMTGLDTIALNMPIMQDQSQYELSNRHIQWLESNWKNVNGRVIDLSSSFEALCRELDRGGLSDLAEANTRARLRMAALYAIAGSNNGMVIGTGNKIEDFGVGFFTKYGDGGVDISPIADLYKSEVYSLGKNLGILSQIMSAPPTDGLWNDGRTDEEQIGATYEELEWAMEQSEESSLDSFNEREREVMEIFQKLHKENKHKMCPIPIFKIGRKP
ncbi:MAG: NAD(+) synthase [Euryarchaeota archaeon]|nr:NAD(+) synthase [Euryarchaeota archaeon]